MPTYEYRCQKCGREFSVMMSMSRHEHEEVVCPDCRAKEVSPQISLFSAKTSKKS